MKLSAEIEDQGALLIALSATMTLAQWELVLQGLNTVLDKHYNHDVAELRSALQSLTMKVRRTFSSEPRDAQGQ